MKFNMGCGQHHQPGYVNVDLSASSTADQVYDLEQTPWPWPDDCADEVLFNHSLEHMGGEPRVFLAIMAELYRICRPGALVKINVPHPRHDDFISDPTHVRAITPRTLELFDRALNERNRLAGHADTPLATYISVDFELTKREIRLDEPHHSRLMSGELNAAEAMVLVRERNNFAREYRLELVAHKPARVGG